MAVSGSFRPLPVTVHTITEPSLILPALMSRIAPPIDAADAGSTNTPSYIESMRCASKISASVSSSNQPSESRTTALAWFQLCGLPIRIAVATVSGFSTGAPRKNGAAPDA